MSVKILVLFYSTYGHIYKMAKAIADGAKLVEHVVVDIKRVPETILKEILDQIGASQAQKEFEHIPIAKPEDLANYDAIVVGTPTRFGNMAGQMRNFWDQTGALWAKGALIGKVGSVFTSSATQHGGQETTIITTMITLLHHGLIIVGLPFAFQGLMKTDEMSGGSPYGSSTIAGPNGSRMPSQNELEGAKWQGKHVAEIAKKIKRGST